MGTKNNVKFKKLYVYTIAFSKDEEGALVFQNGELTVTNRWIKFSYTSLSDGEEMLACFRRDSIAGFSWTGRDE